MKSKNIKHRLLWSKSLPRHLKTKTKVGNALLINEHTVVICNVSVNALILQKDKGQGETGKEEKMHDIQEIRMEKK